jgi:hypothetical protein
MTLEDIHIIPIGTYMDNGHWPAEAIYKESTPLRKHAPCN